MRTLKRRFPFFFNRKDTTCVRLTCIPSYYAGAPVLPPRVFFISVLPCQPSAIFLDIPDILMFSCHDLPQRISVKGDAYVYIYMFFKTSAKHASRRLKILALLLMLRSAFLLSTTQSMCVCRSAPTINLPFALKKQKTNRKNNNKK